MSVISALASIAWACLNGNGMWFVCLTHFTFSAKKITMFPFVRGHGDVVRLVSGLLLLGSAAVLAAVHSMQCARHWPWEVLHDVVESFQGTYGQEQLLLLDVGDVHHLIVSSLLDTSISGWAIPWSGIGLSWPLRV